MRHSVVWRKFCNIFEESYKFLRVKVVSDLPILNQKNHIFLRSSCVNVMNVFYAIKSNFSQPKLWQQFFLKIRNNSSNRPTKLETSSCAMKVNYKSRMIPNISSIIQSITLYSARFRHLDVWLQLKCRHIAFVFQTPLHRKWSQNAHMI